MSAVLELMQEVCVFLLFPYITAVSEMALWTESETHLNYPSIYQSNVTSEVFYYRMNEEKNDYVVGNKG